MSHMKAELERLGERWVRSNLCLCVVVHGRFIYPTQGAERLWPVGGMLTE